MALRADNWLHDAERKRIDSCPFVSYWWSRVTRIDSLFDVIIWSPKAWCIANCIQWGRAAGLRTSDRFLERGPRLRSMPWHSQPIILEMVEI
jgi:hypothetical protein